MPLIDFASAVKSEMVYKAAGYAVATYDPDPSLNYAVDARGSYEVVIIVNCGNFTTNGTLEITLQDSDDATTWTELLDEEGDSAVFPTIAESPTGDEVSDNAQYFARINLWPKKRYIGVKALVATAKAQFSVSALLLSYDTKDSSTPSVSV